MKSEGASETQVVACGREATVQSERDRFLWVQAELGVVTWIWEIETNQVRWWGDISPLLGLEPGTFSGALTQYMGHVHPDDAETSRRNYFSVLEGRRPSYRSEERVVWPDGSIHWLETYGRAQYLPSGQPCWMMGVVKDSTERKQIEAALIQSEERFAKVFRASPAAIVVTRLADGLILNTNPNFEEITAFRSIDVVGRTTAEIALWARADDRRRWVTLLRQFGQVRDFPARFRTKHGTIISVVMSSQCMDVDGEPGQISLARDVTEHELVERQALESQRKYAAVFEIVPEAVAITRCEDGAIIEVNGAFIRQLNRSREATLGRSGLEVGLWVRPADRERVLSIIERDGHLTNYDCQFRHADGSTRDILMSCSKIQFDEHPCIVWAWRDVTEIRNEARQRAHDEQAHREELLRLANRDPLTGLPNRNWFMRQLEDAVDAAQSGAYQFAVLFIDFDGFKRINDSIGHAVGDALLKVASRRLQKILPSGNTVARIGGDEFTVLTDRLVDETEAAAAAARMIDAFRQPFLVANAELSIGISIGISLYPRDGRDGDALLRSADIAMYEAKAKGRGRYHFYTDILFRRLTERLEAERALAKALDGNEFVLQYQPRVAAPDNRLVALEALVRWDSPTLGRIPPNQFIPLAEETGLIARLGEQVILQVCAQIARWKSQGLQVVPVSVNVSPQEFQRAELVSCLRSAMTQYRVEPELLEVEITESSTLGENFDAQRRLGELHDLGLNVLIDDFGTGYSSLSQLQKLDVDILKIDRSFTAELCKSAVGEVMVRTIIEMARALGMGVIAEGVETQAQLEVLYRLRCDQMQGFFIGHPLDPADVVELLTRAASGVGVAAPG